MAVKKTKSGKVDRRYLTKAEKEEIKREEDQEARIAALEEAQADNEDGFVKEEGEPKPLDTHPEPDYFADPGMVTPPAREVNPNPDMSPARKDDGHVEYVERDEPAASPSLDDEVVSTLPPPPPRP